MLRSFLNGVAFELGRYVVKRYLPSMNILKVHANALYGKFGVVPYPTKTEPKKPKKDDK